MCLLSSILNCYWKLLNPDIRPRRTSTAFAAHLHVILCASGNSLCESLDWATGVTRPSRLTEHCSFGYLPEKVFQKVNWFILPKSSPCHYNYWRLTCISEVTWDITFTQFL